MRIIHTHPQLTSDTQRETLKRLHHTCVLEIAANHAPKRFTCPKNVGGQGGI